MPDTNTKIEMTLRELVESEQALMTLSNMDMSDSAGWMVAKVLRKATPDLRQYHKAIAAEIEKTGEFTRDDNGVHLDRKHEDYEKNYQKLQKERDKLLDKVTVVLGDGVGVIKKTDLLKALPKRDVGTPEKPEMVPGFIKPWIYAALYWLIVE